MKLGAGVRLVVLLVAGCGAAPARPAAGPPPPPDGQGEEEHASTEEGAATGSTDPSTSMATMDAPERSRPPSTASYEQVMSKPEPVGIDDERTHLSDGQLRAPMGGVFNRCRVPPNAKVTIKTAVQNGRAIGVTVDVRFEHPQKSPPPKRPTRAQVTAAAAQAKSEAKAKKTVAACVDHAVREVVWPPSNRRDSFTTEF